MVPSRGLWQRDVVHPDGITIETTMGMRTGGLAYRDLS